VGRNVREPDGALVGREGRVALGLADEADVVRQQGGNVVSWTMRVGKVGLLGMWRTGLLSLLTLLVEVTNGEVKVSAGEVWASGVSERRWR